MHNKQEELENTKQLEIYDLVALRETRWDELQNWSTASEGHKLFRRMGWEGGAELLLFMLKNGNTVKSCLWVTAVNRLRARG